MNGIRQDQDSQRIENTNENQRSGKLLRICEFLSEVYPELQLYSKAIEWPKRKEGMKWEEEHQHTFNELKDKITSQLVFSLLIRKGKFRVEMDASGHAIRGVLS